MNQTEKQHRAPAPQFSAKVAEELALSLPQNITPSKCRPLFFQEEELLDQKLTPA